MELLEWWEVQLLLVGCLGAFLVVSTVNATQLLWDIFRRWLRRYGLDRDWELMLEQARRIRDV